MIERYPGAEFLGDGHEWGPLPDRGMTTLGLVYHTTETTGRPSYTNDPKVPGGVSPHLTIDARTGQIWQHASLARRVGAMKGFSETGIPANDKSFQIEWICYSDKDIADGSSSRLWVGHWTDEMYELAAEVMAWFVVHAGIVLEVHAPPLGKSWLSGSTSSLRMGRDDWFGFRGLTAHGGVPGQTHWDTGVMDLRRIRDEAAEMIDATAADFDATDDVAMPRVTDVGAPPGFAKMFPLVHGDQSEDVRFIKRFAKDAGLLRRASMNDLYDDDLRDAIASRFLGNPNRISGSQAAALIQDASRRRMPLADPVDADTDHLTRGPEPDL
jgi:N-acetylmuramoyl-L-alanine amidase